MKNSYLPLILLIVSLYTGIGKLAAQVPTCGTNVPYFNVNLTGNPAATWYSPGHARDGNCCGTISPDRCTSFEVILDTGAAMINFNIASGAIPTGSMFYQIGCGPQIPVGQPICIVGPGPHHVTFCKPGNNQNTYFIQSIPKPIFPAPQHVRIGCSQPINVLGIDTASITWNSIYPGTSGQYNSYLSCTSGCVSPVYTPATNAPAYVDYLVCGTPIATACGYVAVCDTVRIYNESSLSASVTPNPATFCASGSGVVLSASGAGGYGAFSYIWKDQVGNTVGTNASYNASAAGIYSVEVRDALFNSSTCPAFFVSVPVTVGYVPVVDAGADNMLCPTAPEVILNGSIQNATGGTWSGGSGTFDPDNTTLQASYIPTPAEISAGSVTLYLTSTGAGGGCPNIIDTVTIFYPPSIGVTLSGSTVLCSNNTATITPVVSGGIPPYSYLWNTGATTSSITSSQGNYCVNVTDNMGCEKLVCTNIIAPPAIAVSISSTNVSVNGGNDGTATAAVSGGVSPYTYSWSPGAQTTATATGLSYGVYTVTVTDANGCSFVSSVVVNEPRCLSFETTASNSDVLCYGQSNASATVVASGGTPPYTYSWNDPLFQNTATANGLAAGTYQVIVADANNCKQVENITIEQPAQLVNAMNQTNVSIVGGTDGSASSNPMGGTPVYSFSWNTGATTQSITNLSAGTYTLDIADQNNCHLIDSVSISQPPCLMVLASSATNVSCAGLSDGAAVVYPLHGTAPFTYSWNNGATGSSVSNVIAGTYVVTVTDANGCIAFRNITITQPSVLDIALAPNHIRCFDTNDGSIELAVTGGTFPYSYSWSNGISVEDQANLTDATYSVTVTDAKGCTASANTTIIRPTQLSLSYVPKNVTCFGGNDGAIDITVSGGLSPYYYSWSNGATSEDVMNLPSAQYFVTVTDLNGCILTTPLGILIDEPEPLVSLSHTVDCPVPGSGVSLVNVNPAGGWSGPYQVSFDNGTTWQNAGDYNALLPLNAVYYLMVKDSNGCTSVSAVDTVGINPQVVVSNTNYSSCYYDTVTSGLVTITAAGGNGGAYSVSFDNGLTYNAPGAYSFTLDIDSAYSVVVKDGIGCSSEAVQVTLPQAFNSGSVLSAYNSFNISCKGAGDGSIDLSSTGGTIPYTYTWSNGMNTQDISGLGAGSYSVIIQDANACADTLSFILTEPAALTANSTSSLYNGYGISCNGDANGNIDLSAAGGVLPYTFQWSNSAVTEDIAMLSAGTYSVIVTDDNNCTTTWSAVISQPAPLNSSIALASNYNGWAISCNGLSDAAIDLNVNGGVPAYSYQWNTGAATEDLSSVPAGVYEVVITDLNACKDTISITIAEPSQVNALVDSLSNFNGYNVSCYGASDANANISVSGGAAGYTYSWSNGTANEDLLNVTAGTYSMVVSDVNGCNDTISVLLTQPAMLTANAQAITDFNGYQVACYGQQSGSVDLTVNGGVLPYSYQWSNGAATQDLVAMAAGIYTVAVTDFNNCLSSATVTLIQPAQLIGSITSVSNYNNYEISCNGNSDGYVDVNVNGGVSAYTYSWSNGSTTQDLSGAAAGTYSLVITDQNNCNDTVTITLAEPSAITASVSSLSDYNGYNISCNGENDGAVNVTVNGGVIAYDYSWSNGSIQQNLAGIGAGTYSLTVSDSNNCVVTLSVTLTEPVKLTATGAVTSDYNGYEVSCFGGNNGSIAANGTGGVAPYTLTWSNGATGNNNINLTAGFYAVTVSDLNGCEAALQFTLSEPPAVQISAEITHVLCNGFTNGGIDLTLNGGVSPYLFAWSQGAVTEDLQGISSDTYSVVVTDLNNCIATGEYTVEQSKPVYLALTSSNVTCNGLNNGWITSDVGGGQPGYTYSWSNGNTQPDISLLSPGVYQLTVKDTNNCEQVASVVITEPQELTASLTSPVMEHGYNISFFHGTDGSIKTTTSGGTVPYTFSWSNGDSTENLVNIPAGTYVLTVKDENGCVTTASITLTEPMDLAMPTGYSPNEDGKNDNFVVRGIEAYPDNVLTVFNRWGNEVYQKTSYQNKWNGKSTAGAELPDGTYFVVLEINNGAITLKGYVDIRR